MRGQPQAAVEARAPPSDLAGRLVGRSNRCWNVGRSAVKDDREGLTTPPPLSQYHATAAFGRYGLTDVRRGLGYVVLPSEAQKACWRRDRCTR
jgi:hypothetical protein